MNIQERARALERALGLAGNQPVRPAAPPPDPTQLVTPAQWLEIWAASEAAVVTATIDGFLRWIPQLTLQPCQIQGSLVLGQPGCVFGPPLLLRQQLQSTKGYPSRAEARKFCEKAVDRLERQLTEFVAQLAPLGLNWYPTYAMAPGPVPPPVPNVPAKLGDLVTAGGVLLRKEILQVELRGALDSGWSRLYGGQDVGQKVCDGIAEHLSRFFSDFVNAAMITGVKGQGTVVGYAPPANMTGPVQGLTLPAMGFITPIPVDRPDWHL